jgi:Asp-tRNA(Asn)/Glu-tRNA(Gln) amidotransferase A subunit family amidase
MPHGVTLVAPLFEEGRLAQAGIALERAFSVAADRPAGF